MPKWKTDITDSKHPERDLSHHKLTAVTYEPIWQGIRQGLSFRSYDSVRRSIAICQAYLDKSPSDEELLRRMVRVRNILTAIPVYDWRQKPDSVVLIQQATLRLNLIISETDKHIYWDWDTARKQAYDMYASTLPMFNDMHRDLHIRTGRTRGPKVELHYFLDILDEVINDAERT